MKRIGFLLIAVALFGVTFLGACKPKAAEPAAESTEQVAPEGEATEEAAPAEEVPAETPAETPSK